MSNVCTLVVSVMAAILMGCHRQANPSPLHVTVDFIGIAPTNCELRVIISNSGLQKIAFEESSLPPAGFNLAVIAVPSNYVIPQNLDLFGIIRDGLVLTDSVEIQPNGSRTNSICLESYYYDGLRDQNKSSDLMVLWTYQVKPIGHFHPSRFSGSVLIPQIPHAK